MYDSGNHSGLKNPFIAPAKAFLSLVPNDQASCHMSFFIFWVQCSPPVVVC
jgi:hypothetical protein